MAIIKNNDTGKWEIVTDRSMTGEGIETKQLDASDLINILIAKGLLVEEDIV